MIKVITRSILETIQFYADNGDLPSAAHMALLFYSELDEIQQKDGSKDDKDKDKEGQEKQKKVKIDPKQAYLMRVIASYFDLLTQL